MRTESLAASVAMTFAARQSVTCALVANTLEWAHRPGANRFHVTPSSVRSAVKFDLN
jgi:hypothetical protein